MAKSDIDRWIKFRLLRIIGLLIRLRLLDPFSPVGAHAVVAKSSPNLRTLGTSTKTRYGTIFQQNSCRARIESHHDRRNQIAATRKHGFRCRDRRRRPRWSFRRDPPQTA